MRKINRKVLIIGLLFALCICLTFSVSCKKENNNNDSSSDGGSQTVVELTLDRSEATMVYGDELTLIPTYSGKDGETPVWDSSNKSVAVVDNGTITAIGCGNTEITVSYGGKTAKCAVTVSFGNVYPELVLNSMPETVRLGKGRSFAVDANVMFNGKRYECNYSVDVTDENVVDFTDGKLVAKSIGSTKVTIKGVWNSFDGALMQKTIDVEVFNDVTLNALVTINDETYASNVATIYLTDEWNGVEYGTEAKIEFVVRDNGVEKTIQGELASDQNAVSYENGVVKAINEGSAVYVANYTDSIGNNYSISVDITVICPIADYSEKIELCTDEAFPVETYFGRGATIISATSAGKTLEINDGVIAIVAKGVDTPALEIKTNKGGYRFNNVYTYTRKINKQNFASTFTLTDGKVIDGYYVLEENIDGLTVSSQRTGSATTYFKGTFDGKGHTIKATAGTNGLFGALNDGATIKNVKFEFTFPSGVNACGLAKNQGTFNNGKPVYLKNIYVVTTNYTTQACSLMDNMPDALEMTDVMVKINGNAALGEFIDVNSCRTALFRVDQSYNDGKHGSYEGKFINIKVITESFIPISNGKRWDNSIFTSYAVNDEDKLGTFNREQKVSYMYYHLIDANEEGSAKKLLFGANTYSYGAHADYKNGGILRYDTAEELIASGVTEVGSWTVE